MLTEPVIALTLDWTAVSQRVAAMAAAIRHDGAPTAVVGVLRGGMVPAVWLAHHLGVRDVRAMALRRTLDEGPTARKTGHPEVLATVGLGEFDTAADVLVVDDVAGSGASLATATALVAGHVTRVRSAVLVVNTANWSATHAGSPREVVDYIGVQCAGWVRFPWEVR